MKWWLALGFLSRALSLNAGEKVVAGWNLNRWWWLRTKNHGGRMGTYGLKFEVCFLLIYGALLKGITACSVGQHPNWSSYLAMNWPMQPLRDDWFQGKFSRMPLSNQAREPRKSIRLVVDNMEKSWTIIVKAQIDLVWYTPQTKLNFEDVRRGFCFRSLSSWSNGNGRERRRVRRSIDAWSRLAMLRSHRWSGSLSFRSDSDVVKSQQQIATTYTTTSHEEKRKT